MNRKIMFMSFGIILAASFSFAQEQISVSAYYPAPYGAYQRLSLHPNSTIDPITDPNCSNNGEMFYYDASNSIYLCSAGTWQEIIAVGGGGAWTRVGTNLYTGDSGSPTQYWKVGVGTTGPQGKFHVDPVSAGSSDDFVIGDNANYGNIGIGTINPTSRLEIASNIATRGSLGFFSAISSDRNMWFDPGSDNNFYFVNTSASGKTVFAKFDGIALTPVVKILNSGRVGIGLGSADPAYTLDVKGSVHIGRGAQGSIVFNSLPADVLSYRLGLNASRAVVKSLLSSLRYKKDIIDLDIDTAKIYSLRPVSFSWQEQNTRDFGLIAEEVDEILPQMATYNKDGDPESVQYEKLAVLLLIESKKLKDHINNLESRLKILKEKREGF
ncbi:MAG: tail fiber domain-containing protein [Candidatus Omnitrophica bacterium]|nr:tail fiber domain-containing protein [Candidatus Omnitrophota bacterium]